MKIQLLILLKIINFKFLEIKIDEVLKKIKKTASFLERKILTEWKEELIFNYKILC